MQNSEEVVGVTELKVWQQTTEVHSTQVFIAHTFGKGHINNQRGIFVLFLWEIFCKIFVYGDFFHFFDLHF